MLTHSVKATDLVSNRSFTLWCQNVPFKRNLHRYRKVENDQILALVYLKSGIHFEVGGGCTSRTS
jgi:hypothetical protein